MRTGKEKTRWKCKRLRMKNWKRFWNKEERAGVTLQAEVLQKVQKDVPMWKSERHRRNEES